MFKEVRSIFKLFDIANEKIRERKLKFIEILLIVGGIIGGIRLKQGDPLNQTFGAFLIVSILYYSLVSNLKEDTVSKNKVFFNILFFSLAFIIARYFSLIAILPLATSGTTINVLRALLTILIVFSLYSGEWK
jgi:hypothetical protein